MPGGDGGGGGGLFFAVKKLLHNSSFFRSRGENHLFMDLRLQSDREELSQSLLFHSQGSPHQVQTPSQSSLSSEESLPRIIGNELGLDTERMSLKSSEDGLKSSDSHFSMLPLVNYVSSADEDSQLGHNQITPASYVSSHSLCLSRNGSISSGAFQEEESFLSHPSLVSVESLPVIAGNELGFDDEMMSLTSAEDWLRNLGYVSMSSVRYFSMAPSIYSDYSHQCYNTVSPVSAISLGSLRQNSIRSSIIQRDSSSPSTPTPNLSSEEYLPGFARYVLSLDMERNSIRSSEEWLPSSENRSISSANYFSVASSDDEESYRGHHQTTSALSSLHNSSFSCVGSGDGNEVSYFLSPVGLPSHLHSILHRACENLLLRMVSPANKARANRVEVWNHVKKLVEDLQDTCSDVCMNAAAELLVLASLNVDNQILIASYGAIALLINLVHSVVMELQEMAVIALLYLSYNDFNKLVMVDSGAIEPLIHVLSTGSHEAQDTSSAILFNLSHIEVYKVKIDRAIKAAIKCLFHLMANGTPRDMRDAATALYNLSRRMEYKSSIVQAGAVKHVIKLMCPAFGMVDEAVCVLSNLSDIFDGRREIFQEGGIPFLVEILELGSSRAKEDAAVALLNLCVNSTRYCNMVLRLGAIPPLMALSNCSNPRAQEVAEALIIVLRAVSIG